jgi:cell division protein FtsA
VVNIDEAANAIRESVGKCERLSGYVIESAYVGITGSHIGSMTRRGVVAVSPHGQEITAEDVNRAMEAARVQAIANDREIIHAAAGLHARRPGWSARPNRYGWAAAGSGNPHCYRRHHRHP